jgi:hypothetical protein
MIHDLLCVVLGMVLYRSFKPLTVRFAIVKSVWRRVIHGT